LWILGVLLALALLGAALWYLKNVLHALKREKRGNKLGRTHLVIHKQFSELKEAVASEILALEHAKTRRELSEEEEKFVERLKVMLSSAEKTIENELDSVT
jgi:hypothetical protein